MAYHEQKLSEKSGSKQQTGDSTVQALLLVFKEAAARELRTPYGTVPCQIPRAGQR